VYSDTPAIDSGVTAAQFFVGMESLVCDIHPLQNDKQFVNVLQDNITKRGAMTKLISDRAQVEISKKVQDILCHLFIMDWQSEPHQQQQNFAERRYQDVKRMANCLMDWSGAPPSLWLLALMYVCFVTNLTANASINNAIPVQVLDGVTPDISPVLQFVFYEPVYYKVHENAFPSESSEKTGRFVGISEDVGHALTYKVLTDDTKKVIYRSIVRSAMDPVMRINRPMLDMEKEPHPHLKSRIDDMVEEKGKDEVVVLPIVHPEELTGRTFLVPIEDGQVHRAKIVQAIEEQQYAASLDPTHLKFCCSMNEDEYEEILSYQEIIDYLEKDEDNPVVWKFKKIVSHQGPLTPNSPGYKGSSYNVQVEWENGEVTDEPLSIIAADDPVTCAVYARDHNLLSMPGWK
jgi:hypothetical protein